MTPQEIEQIIEMLAEKLGPIGGQVWGIYVRQVYVSVIAETALGILSLLVCVGSCLGLVWCEKARRRVIDKNPYSICAADGESMWLVVVGIIAGITGFMAVSLLSALFKLLNPHYYAIQMLLGR